MVTAGLQMLPIVLTAYLLSLFSYPMLPPSLPYVLVSASSHFIPESVHSVRLSLAVV